MNSKQRRRARRAGIVLPVRLRNLDDRHWYRITPTATLPFHADAIRDTAHPRNWQQDYSHENGNYCCRCHDCGEQFLGHKRRVVCALCAEVQP